MEFKTAEETRLETTNITTSEASVKLRDMGFTEQDLQKISEDVQELKHGYESPGERVKLLLKNPIYIDKDDNLMIPYWLESAKRPQGGDCVDLAEDLMFKWHIESFVDDIQAKGCDTLFCQGTGPDFFQGASTNHIFLAIGKSKNNDRRNFVESDMVVVDPSLQIVDILTSAKYSIREANLNLTSLSNELHKSIKPVVIPPNENEAIHVKVVKNQRLIIGLDPSRDFALFLSVGKFKDKYSPFLTVYDKDAKDGAVLISPLNSKLIDTTPQLKNSTKGIRLYLHKLVNELQQVNFLKARYIDGKPVDLNGAPLTGSYHKSVI